jgi:protein involved in polysaccharide export with SLBB domain
MSDKRVKPGKQRRWWLVMLLLAFAGCAGNRLTLFPERHNLLDVTRQTRDSTPVAPDVPRELEKHVLPTYLVEPGDVLLVMPADLDSPVRLPGDQPVLPDGTISLGPYGRPVVAGKSIEEIEAIARQLVALKHGILVPVTVRLVSRQSKVFYVLGEVNSPGAFPLSGRECVLDGIIAAGGLTQRASLQDIILSRPTKPNECRVVLPVCYRGIVELADTTTNYQLAPGDRIFVPSKAAWEDLLGCRQERGPCAGKHHACCVNAP